MLRLFIEFLGVKSVKKPPGQLTVAKGEGDSLMIDAFKFKGCEKVKPSDFGRNEKLMAETHRVLCKINAHFTYNKEGPKRFYDRIESPDNETQWKQAVDIVVKKLDECFYQKVKQPITVHFDLESDFKTQFAKRLKLKSAVKGDGLGPIPYGPERSRVH